MPPPEPEEQFSSPALAQQQTRQKHYKIIFIKAPSSSGGQSFNSPALYNPPEEKTLVYVLVKKNEPYLDVASPSLAPAHVPSKPEVYFIKYKSVAKDVGATAQGGGGFSGGDLGQALQAPAPAIISGSGFSDVDPRGSSGSAGAIAVGSSEGYWNLWRSFDSS